jgi:hypothetical protein
LDPYPQAEGSGAVQLAKGACRARTVLRDAAMVVI